MNNKPLFTKQDDAFFLQMEFCFQNIFVHKHEMNIEVASRLQHWKEIVKNCNTIKTS